MKVLCLPLSVVQVAEPEGVEGDILPAVNGEILSSKNDRMQWRVTA